MSSPKGTGAKRSSDKGHRSIVSSMRAAEKRAPRRKKTASEDPGAAGNGPSERTTGVADTAAGAAPALIRSTSRKVDGVGWVGVQLKKRSHPATLIGDVGEALKRHPLVSIGLALGLGILLGRRLGS